MFPLLSLTQRISAPLFAREFVRVKVILVLLGSRFDHFDCHTEKMSSLSAQYFSFFKMMTETLVMEDLSVLEYAQARGERVRVMPYRITDAHVVNVASRPLFPLARTDLMERPTFTRADLACLVLLQHISVVRLMQFICIPSRLSQTNPEYIMYLLNQFKPVSQLIKCFYWQLEITPAFDRVLVGVSSIALWLQTNYLNSWPNSYDFLPQGFDMGKVASAYSGQLSIIDLSFTLPDTLEFYPRFPRKVLKPNATEHQALFNLRHDTYFSALLKVCVENASSAAGAELNTMLTDDSHQNSRYHNMALTFGQWQTTFIGCWVVVYEPFRTGNHLLLYWEATHLIFKKRAVNPFEHATIIFPCLIQSPYNAVMREVFLSCSFSLGFKIIEPSGVVAIPSLPSRDLIQTPASLYAAKARSRTHS
ncbi:hypothetical protein R3P38DRAFT_2803161 [Favolaschia claudopus]|uniref:Uncharacterized protein n=1 Tax=Favolaschia claudopus TaxID=2862362 RepID=A0AAV9ZT67_9AGAR